MNCASDTTRNQLDIRQAPINSKHTQVVLQGSNRINWNQSGFPLLLALMVTISPTRCESQNVVLPQIPVIPLLH